jgi:hypothetical protein
MTICLAEPRAANKESSIDEKSLFEKRGFFVLWGQKMKINYKYVYLSDQFYEDYPKSQFPELLRKSDRPYIMFLIKTENLTFAIPFRSNIFSTLQYFKKELTSDFYCDNLPSPKKQ